MSKILLKEKFSHKKKRPLIAASVSIFVLLITLFYITVTRSGHWLVEDDEFEHVNWVIVLDGQSADMERSDFAADLLSQGKADSVVIMGRRVFRDKSNADFYADDFMRLGSFDSTAVFVAHHDDPSTLAEACTIIPWLKKRHADTVLLITSAPATRRAAMIFRHLSGETPVYITKDLHHYQYTADSWMFNRESRKNWIREWAALFVAHWDLWGVGQFSEDDATDNSAIRSLAEEELDDPTVDLKKMTIDITEKSSDDVKADTLDTDSLEKKAPKDSSTADSSSTNKNSSDKKADAEKKNASDKKANSEKKEAKADSEKKNASDKKADSEKKDSTKKK